MSGGKWQTAMTWRSINRSRDCRAINTSSRGGGAHSLYCVLVHVYISVMMFQDCSEGQDCGISSLPGKSMHCFCHWLVPLSHTTYIYVCKIFTHVTLCTYIYTMYFINAWCTCMHSHNIGACDIVIVSVMMQASWPIWDSVPIRIREKTCGMSPSITT